MTIEQPLQAAANQILRDNEAELDFIIRFESGEIEDIEDLAAGFQLLIDSGIIWHLQGVYQRTARELINNGHCELSND